MVILVDDDMECRLVFYVLDLVICIIFEHVDSNKEVDGKIRRQMEMKLLIRIGDLE